jgi:hypothetical protein
MQKLFIEPVSMFMAASIGIYSIRFKDYFYRNFIAQILLSLTTYFFSYFLLAYQEKNGIPKNNHWLYNSGMVLESILLLLNGFIYFRSSHLKWLPVICVVIFVVTFLVEISYTGFRSFATYSCIVESFCVTVVYISILNDQFEKHGTEWYKAPIALICIGILVYFICNVPYISLMNYFQRLNPSLNRFLFLLVTDFLANVRYLLLAIAFWQVRRNKLTLNWNFNE